jgi:hypothetical protein
MATTKKVSVTSTSSPSLLNSTGFDNYTWTEAKTAGANTFIVDKATKTGALTLTGTGDTLKIDGYSGDFTASISGTKLTLTGTSSAGVTQTLKVALPAATTTKATFNLSFTDGAQHVDYIKGSAATLINGTHSATLTAVALPVYGQTAHEAAALIAAATAQAAAVKAALTDAAGRNYATVDTAITSNDTAAISAAISTATAAKFNTVADLVASYTAYQAVAPTFSVSALASSLEGANATFTVSLSGSLTTAASVNLSLAGVTGATEADYSSTGSVVGASVSNNVLTFAPGQTSAVLTFPITTDSLAESGEGLALTLAQVSGSVVGVKTASATTQIADPTSTANLSATNTAGTATAGADTFNIASGTYTGTIGNFANGDKLSFFIGASLTVLPDTNQTDGIQQISAADPTTGATTTITFNGLTAAQDAGVFNVDSFNTLFGAGTIGIVSPVPVTPPATTASLSSTALTVAGTTGVDTFNIASGTYAATISNFANGDKLSFFTGASVTVLPDSNQTDGIQQISAADPATGATATITLTGLTSVQDAGVFNVSSFNTIFGAGTIG